MSSLAADGLAERIARLKPRVPPGGPEWVGAYTRGWQAGLRVAVGEAQAVAGPVGRVVLVRRLRGWCEAASTAARVCEGADEAFHLGQRDALWAACRTARPRMPPNANR